MSDPLIRTRTEAGVTTLTMSNPSRLNGWTTEMIAELLSALSAAAADEACGAAVLTGTDPYYSAGVNLGGRLSLRPPAGAARQDRRAQPRALRRLHRFSQAYPRRRRDAPPSAPA